MYKDRLPKILGLVISVALVGCANKPDAQKPDAQKAMANKPMQPAQGQADKSTGPGETSAKQFSLRSPAFGHMQIMPVEFRHSDVGGKNESPPLEWTEPPAGTQSFVLLCLDPDAPGGEFVHWVLYNIPSDVRKLERNLGRSEKLPNGALQGKNDFDEIGYDGPAPPPGKPHRYVFRLYAVKTKLDLPPKATRADVEKAMQGHILAQAEWIGLYGSEK
ncbi:MAG: YbhB/YbcL family Raf kinase inhibitor-like protein [Gemmatales bacterium]|nr:YbhB/YbcL family Raf kinase inhibitor-like protein [Gemmatales bacterium]MDW7994040.1 YbhB/YbcL family Raf kinase inhibitor-like protein [Gemmatales bacterium]